MTNTDYDQLMEYIIKSQNIVALTGAGISTSSGIPDFRSPKGIYADPSIDGERVFDINVFKDDPLVFGKFFIKLYRQIKEAEPTKAHKMLKKIQDMGKLHGVITQNLDSLHTKSGIKNVIEVHGHAREYVCINSVHHRIDTDKIPLEKIEEGTAVICPECNSFMKPDIIFFGEHVKDLEKALTVVQKADLLLIMGTSLTVYPVNGLPDYCTDNTKIVILNATETPYDHKAHLIIRDDLDVIAQKLRMA